MTESIFFFTIISNNSEGGEKNFMVIVSDKKDILNPNCVSFEERKKELQIIDALEKNKRKKEKNSPFIRWTQFNNEHTKELMLLAIKYPKAHAILYFLVDQMDNYNACVCSSKVLEEVLGISRQTVFKNIKLLKDLGFLAVFKSGNANVYVINDEVYWKSWGNNRKYSKFPANVILGLSEQEKEYQVNLKNIKSKKIKNISIKN